MKRKKKSKEKKSKEKGGPIETGREKKKWEGGKEKSLLGIFCILYDQL